MTVELVTTGSELMLGRVLNTHQQWLCRQLADRGYVVDRQVAVPDTAEAIPTAVREALGRADLVITTGGLGPTSDDRTRELLASLLGRELRHDPAVEEGIRRYFTSRGRPVPDRCLIEALVPEGAGVLPNAHGTAPGLAIRVEPNPYRVGGEPSLVIMLPGPPRELRPMFLDQVVPILTRELPPPGTFVCRTLRTTGLGESWMEDRLAGPLAGLVADGLEIGYCARVGEVDVRLVSRGDGAVERVAAAEGIVRREAGDHVFGVDDENLESVLVRELTAAGRTLALAESCTGGFIAHRITNVPGASRVLRAGLVTYSNDAKRSLLGVDGRTLELHGAVSEATAREMASGARRVTGADLALAVTGIAGPDGGSEAKPVGTVFLAVEGPVGGVVRRQLNAFDRETFKYLTAQQGLMMLRRLLGGGGGA